MHFLRLRLIALRLDALYYLRFSHRIAMHHAAHSHSLGCRHFPHLIYKTMQTALI